MTQIIVLSVALRLAISIIVLEGLAGRQQKKTDYMCVSVSLATRASMIITSRSKGLKNWHSRLGWSISENPRKIGEPDISGAIYNGNNMLLPKFITQKSASHGLWEAGRRNCNKY